MTIADRTAATDEQFADLLARVEAADEAEESLRERVARAMTAALGHDGALWDDPDGELDRQGFRCLADAALDVIRTPAGDRS